MQKIYKYALDIVDKQIIDIISPAIPLSVEEQEGNIVIYALVDNNSDSTIPVEVLVIGTGNDILQDLSAYKFIGTVKMAGRSLMWHIFVKHSVEVIDLRGGKISEPRIIDA